METWARDVQESFRSVKVFAIYKIDKLILSKKSLSLKTRGLRVQKKVPSNFIFFYEPVTYSMFPVSL